MWKHSICFTLDLLFSFCTSCFCYPFSSNAFPPLHPTFHCPFPLLIYTSLFLSPSLSLSLTSRASGSWSWRTSWPLSYGGCIGRTYRWVTLTRCCEEPAADSQCHWWGNAYTVASNHFSSFHLQKHSCFTHTAHREALTMAHCWPWTETFRSTPRLATIRYWKIQWSV